MEWEKICLEVSPLISSPHFPLIYMKLQGEVIDWKIRYLCCLVIYSYHQTDAVEVLTQCLEFLNEGMDS